MTCMANWKTSCFTPPWRRSGVGLKRCSGSPKDSPPSRSADTFQVSRQTVYNWAERFRQREGLDLRARLLDAPRSGRPPLISGIIDPLIEAAFAQDPRELGYQSTVWTAELLVHYLGQAHGIQASRKSVSLAITRLHLRWKRPHISWRRGRKLGAKQKGAKTRPQGSLVRLCC